MTNKIINTSLSKAKPTPNKKGNSKKKSGKFNFLKLTLQTVAILFFLVSMFFILVFIGVFGPVPSKQQLQDINNPVASEVLSSNGKVIGRYYIENRSNIRFDEISPSIINALIATEDSRFYEHLELTKLHFCGYL